MKVENGVLTSVNEKDLKKLANNPDKFWKGVEEVSEFAFSGLTLKGEITISEGVKRIQPNAFHWDNEITKIKFPASLESIGHSAFYQCTSLQSIEFEKGLKIKRIRVRMFYAMQIFG